MIVVYAFVIWIFLLLCTHVVLIQWFINNGAQPRDVERYIMANVNMFAGIYLLLILCSFVVASVIA